MSWPIGPDYNDAIQNPQANLRDPCLRRGTVVTNRLGLPAVNSGRFASVFQVHEGSQKWAVKCFTWHIRDQQDRYKAISDHLKAHPLPFTVQFDYQPEGILVRGTWYPILRMQWLDGPLLDEYIRSHLKNTRALQLLASRWRACSREMQRAGIAHGDLQVGNIKVVGDNIRLIDYDGMYVPAIKNKGSSERGHQNFQHPQRSDSDFDQYIDNFPSWVIYASLLAVAEFPSIWAEADGGDDCLIFRKADFESPDSSRVFRKLEQVGSQSLRAVLMRLRSYSRMAPPQVPTLEASQPEGGGPRPGGGTSTANPPQGLPTWIGPIAPSETERPSRSKETLRTALEGKELKSSRDIFVAAGILCVVGVILGTSLEVPRVMIFIMLTAVTSGAVLLVDRSYHAFRHRAGIPNMEKAIKELDHQVVSLSIRKASLDTLCMESREDVDNAEAVLARYAAEVARSSSHWETEVNAIRHSCDNVVQLMTRKAGEALAKRQAEHQARLTALKQQLNLLDVHCTSRLTSRLKAEQSQFVEALLRDHELRDVRFEGLGDTLQGRLKRAGFFSAYDVLAKNPRNVGGIGTARAYALEEWARGLRDAAEKAAPKQLPPQVRDEILSEFSQKRQEVDLQVSDVERKLKELPAESHESLRVDVASVRQRHQQDEDRVASKRAEWESSARSQSIILQAALQQRRADFASATQTLSTDRRNLDRDESALVARRSELKRNLERFRGLTFSYFLSASLRLT